MNKSNNKQGDAKKEPRCDPKQFDLLKKSSEKKNMTEWNNWRDENPEEEIRLVPMNESEENQADTQKELKCDQKQLELLKKCSEKKDMTEWNKWRKENRYRQEIWLQRSDLSKSNLEGAILDAAHLEESKLYFANLEKADISTAHLERADLGYADLGGANLVGTHLEGADLTNAYLKGAKLGCAYLQEATLDCANLEGARFTASIVDGLTVFWECSVDRNTDFRGVGLESCRIDEPTKYLLQYNKRRLNWIDWYKGANLYLGGELGSRMRLLLTSPVRLFWCLSDYGRSTIRILGFFVALAIVFAVAYWAKPDCVMVNGQVGGLEDFLHALYFSVVTMTTLGFGDIAANPASGCGQVLLMLQVFCGYFLLGAIVTRLSILFTAGGPAGRFSKKQK